MKYRKEQSGPKKKKKNFTHCKTECFLFLFPRGDLHPKKKKKRAYHLTLANDFIRRDV